MKRKIALGLGGTVFAALIILAVVAYEPAPDLDVDLLRAAASDYSVTIHRDTFGVPHIYGTRDRDVGFGIGYAHAEDDFENIALSLAMGRGQLARYEGVSGSQTDYMVQLFRNVELVDARYDTDLSEDVRALLEGYAAGVNLYAADHLEQYADSKWAGLLPATAKDIVQGFVLRFPFFFGIEKELGRIFDPNGFEKPDIGGEVDASMLTRDTAPIGSNAFAIAPSRSAENSTRLAINSHQPYTGPVAWWEVVVHSDEGWHAAGSLFPGSPLILHGHNENLGWANTVNSPDLADTYKITVNPDDPNSYRLDGDWVPFDRRVESLQINMIGPFGWTFEQETLQTVFGPAFRTEHGTFALAQAGRDEIRQVEQTFRLNKATNLDEWMAAMEMNAIPAVNYVYADREGHIGFIYNARMPRRPDGYDWQGLLPGDTSATIWQGIEPFSKLPQLFDPASGYILNANNTPFRVTDSSEDLKSGDYPGKFGIQRNMTNRALRGLDLLGNDPEITAEEFDAYKFDLKYAENSSLVMALNELIEMTFNEPLLIEAQELIRNWNSSADRENLNATVSILTGYNLVSADLETDEEKAEILRRVTGDLVATYAKIDVPWGNVNRIRRGGKSLAIDGGPDVLRAVYGGGGLNDDGFLDARAGDTYIMMVNWDAEGQVSSKSIHQFGAATLDESSPHYADQLEMFVNMEFKPVWFEFDELEPNIESTKQIGSN